MTLANHLGAVRMISTPEIRTDDSGRKTLRGVFVPFNEWATINSWEGHFRERALPGAFKRTISQSWDTFKRIGRHSITVNYNHGMDAIVGSRQLGPISVLEERANGPHYEVPLLDTEYNREYIIPAAEEGLLGSSFRFAVPKNGDVWNENTDDGIPERDLVDVGVFEFGPVDHPAYEAATAGVRTASEYEWWRKLDDEGRAQYEVLLRRASDLGTFTPVEPATNDDSPPLAPVGKEERHAAALPLLKQLRKVIYEQTA